MDGYNKLGYGLAASITEGGLSLAKYKQALMDKLQSSAQEYVKGVTDTNKQEAEQNAFNDSLQKMANEKADPNKVKEIVETSQKQASNKQNAKQINKFETENFTKGGIDNLMTDANKTNESIKHILDRLNGYERYKKSSMNKQGGVQ